MSMSLRRLALMGALVLTSLLSAFPAAADPMRITLTDGSVLTGDVVAMESGQVVVASGALGVVRIDKAKIASMTRVGSDEKASTPAPKSPPASQDMARAAVESLMATDTEAMGELAKLKESALMQEILSDPELMAKVAAGDLTALAEDPRIKRLLEDPTVRSLTKRASE